MRFGVDSALGSRAWTGFQPPPAFGLGVLMQGTACAVEWPARQREGICKGTQPYNHPFEEAGAAATDLWFSSLGPHLLFQ